jgi:probable F420-dependent oxidoreductase
LDVDFGVAIFPTEYSMDMARLASSVEERGFESLWVAEHTHIPARGSDGSNLPRHYSHTLDPFIALTAAASATTKLRVGTAICQVAEREPIVTAKAVASLDVLSGGRFMFGVGAGWLREEMRNLGVDPAQRWEILRERVLAMKEIWTREEAEFHGKHVNFPAIWSWPKPVQAPHPPVLLGGGGKGVIERVVDYADEWLPLDLETGPPWKPRVAELRRLSHQRGRGDIPISVCTERRLDAAAIEEYQALGIHRAIFLIPSTGPDELIPLLDGCARLAGLYA